jgi:hypothetical protein
MTTDVRLLSTYKGFPPQSIISLPDAEATSLVSVSHASLTLTGGTRRYQTIAPRDTAAQKLPIGMHTVTQNQEMQVLIPEGQTVTLTGDASAAATVTRNGASDSWTIGANSVKLIGPYVNQQVLTVRCTAGSVVAENHSAAALPLNRAVTNPNGVVIGSRDVKNKITKAHYDTRNSFLSRAVSGAVASSNTVQTSTFLTVTASPVPYYALRLSIGHLGGNGPITGFKAIVAASDDIGNRDFSDLTAAAFKKCTTPKRGGTEYNTTVSDGSPGWKAVTFSGSSAGLNIADPGTGNRVNVVSDVIYEAGVLDSANNCYPLLVRHYFGSAGLTFVNNLAGLQTGTNAKADFPDYVCMALSRGSTDAVTTPANWSGSSTPSASGSNAEITIEYFHTDGAITTVSVVGDSRSGVSAEFSASKNYKSFERYLGKALTAAGVPNAITCHGISGAVAAAYQTYAMADYTIQTPADWLVYTAYSINEGAPTAAIMALCKARTLQIVEKARNSGQRVLLISAFPAGLNGTPSFNAGQLAMLAELNTFCQNIADITFNAMAVYGNADGSWSGLNFDASHMTDAGYQDMAGRISSLIVNY